VLIITFAVMLLLIETKREPHAQLLRERERDRRRTEGTPSSGGRNCHNSYQEAGRGGPVKRSSRRARDAFWDTAPVHPHRPFSRQRHDARRSDSRDSEADR